jgi:amino acid adenylation domain-containing protein
MTARKSRNSLSASEEVWRRTVGSEGTQARESITKRIAELSPEKRQLLEQLLLKEGVASTHRAIAPRRTNARSLPLSFAQQRLWFVDQLVPGNPIYNIFAPVSFDEEIKVAALERSLNEIVRRHETLRTTFTTSDGQPFQLIAPSLSLPLPVIDLRHRSAQEREADAQRIASAEASRPFDLSRGPLLRATLLRLDDKQSVLLLTMHHILTDGWSMGILFHELRTLYQAYCEGRESPLPELPIQYADYAIWQRQWLQGPVLDKQLAYWRQQLAELPVLQLPTDYPRPAVPSFRGASHYLTIPQRVTEALRELSQREGATLFMTLLAAFQTLLQRYSGQQQIVVGSPIAGRNRAEIEGLIGFFVNTLVLRTDFQGEPSFRELLRRVREVCLGAYAHQDVPFEKLVEELQPDRDLSRNPLFQVTLELFSAPNVDDEPPTATSGWLDIDKGTAVFDVTFHLWDGPEGISGQIEYSTDLFKETTIARLSEHFQVLLAGIVADPDRRVSHLPLLTDSERRTLLCEWNRTEWESPSEATVHGLFEQQVAVRPEAVAAVFGTEQVSYRELNERANQVAGYLRRQGISREELVGLCMERSVEMVVGMLGIVKAGGAYVPIDVEYPVQRVRYMVQDAALRVVLTMQHLRERFLQTDVAPGQAGAWAKQPKVICLDTDWEVIGRESKENTDSVVNAENLAYVIYTSGSTGEPKGVCVPHRAITSLVRNTNYVRLESSDIVAQASNSSFDAITFELWGALLNGARLVGITKGVALSPRDFAAQISEQGISTLFLTTALFNQLASEVPAAFKPLRQLLFGGEAVDPVPVRKVLKGDSPERLLHVYGPTECTTFATWYLVEDVPEDATTVPIGRPIRNTEVYVLDQHLQPLPTGLPGLLFIGGCGLARGYLRRPDLTALSFIPHPFSSQPGARLYCTGDRVRYGEDGVLEFLGREDQQVKVRGYRIELGEIEAVLEQMEGVQRAVVEVMEEGGRAEKRLVAYLVAAEQGHERERPGIGEVRRHLRERLPEYMVPALVMWMERLPLTPNGKLDRRALPAPDRSRPEMEGNFVAPQTAIEEKLAGIWAELLSLDSVGVQDNFFECGGHSLLATQLISRVRNVFQVELPLRRLFDAPTVAGLAIAIEEAKQTSRDETPKIVPISRERHRVKVSASGALEIPEALKQDLSEQRRTNEKNTPT